MNAEAYTLSQASALTGLPLKAVQKLLDCRIIRPSRKSIGRKPQRYLTKQQVVYLRLEAEGVRLLPMVVRRQVAEAIESAPNADFVHLAESQAVVVQVRAARQRVARDLARLKKAEKMAVSDPEIMRGTPVFRATRIPIELVADMLDQGATPSEILAGYPALDLEKVELAPLYMRAFPRRGRPAQRPWSKQKPIRTLRRVPS
jgi:uncharacterized protein (DUF433 family)